MKWIAPARVRRALIALHEWRDRAQPQGSMHLLPFLALLEQGAAGGAAVHFEEKSDFEFWDRYFRIPGDDSLPYFVPLTLERQKSNYPHSNPATIRKNRWPGWGMAEYSTSADESHWKLLPGFDDVFVHKALSKGDETFRVPVVDLAVLLFRHQSFPDAATAKTLEDAFRAHFKVPTVTYDKIFEYIDEDPAILFVSAQPPDSAYTEQILAALAKPALPEAAPPAKKLEDDDLLLARVHDLLALRSSGIILRGVPGTGKSWYARRIAETLVADQNADVFRVQFHPSYGYEDFVEGFKPDQSTDAGFTVTGKVFRKACERARKAPKGKYVVLLIDEINRGDPSRIFGEILTYIERQYRGEQFPLPYSGEIESVPDSLLIIGTMNQYDRSIAQLDAAFIRRFDHVEVLPSAEVAVSFLEQTGAFNNVQLDLFSAWFNSLQALVPPSGIGHAYFKDVTRPEDLQVVWRYRMWPACEAQFELDPLNRGTVQAGFDEMYGNLVAATST